MTSSTRKRRYGFGVSRFVRPRRGTAKPLVTATASPVTPGTVCEPGVRIGPNLSIFHDARETPPVFRQPAGEGVALDTSTFDGSYISQVIDLDVETAAEIRAGRDLVISLLSEAEPAIPTYLRAHFSNEEGREVLHDLIVVAKGERVARMNLDGLRIPIDLATTVWVDVIYKNPAGVALTLRDLTLSIKAQ